MSSWNDFNDAPAQANSLIPKGTLVKVHLNINTGKHNDVSKGWTRDYATKSRSGDSVWLDCELTILDGAYKGRKIFGHKIGLHSPKGDAWKNMGRAQIKAILNSHYGLSPSDMSDEAKTKRSIRDFADLQGIPFAIKIGIEDYQTAKKDEHGIIVLGSNGQPIMQDRQKNTLDYIIEPDELGYAEVMSKKVVTQQEAQTELYKRDERRGVQVEPTMTQRVQAAQSAQASAPAFDDDIPF